MKGVTRRPAVRRVATVALAVALTGATMTGAALAASGSARPAAQVQHTSAAHPAVVRSAVVVRVKTHRPFGKMLFTTHNMALYYLPRGAGSCTGACLGVWPPLMMPAGKTIPKGVSCLLGTAKFGSHHRLQVTYNGRRLYTFASDTPGTVTGNGLEGFKVAKVLRCHH